MMRKLSKGQERARNFQKSLCYGHFVSFATFLRCISSGDLSLLKLYTLVQLWFYKQEKGRTSEIQLEFYDGEWKHAAPISSYRSIPNKPIYALFIRRAWWPFPECGNISQFYSHLSIFQKLIDSDLGPDLRYLDATCIDSQAKRANR